MNGEALGDGQRPALGDGQRPALGQRTFMRSGTAWGGSSGTGLARLTIQGRLGAINPTLERLSAGVVGAELGEVNGLSLEQ